MKSVLYTVLITIALFVSNNINAQIKLKKVAIKTQEVDYVSDGITMKGFIAFDSSTKAKRPAILVVHEWWGSNDYARMRAKMLAELGYIAMAVDLYGDRKIATDPKTAMKYATPFYEKPELAKSRLEAALQLLKQHPVTDNANIAAIGYCFGGSMVLNAAKMGMDFKGVVSFHGGLDGVPASKGVTTAKILVCHGGADQFVSAESVEKFKTNLNDVKVPYKFIVYKGATHAFTNKDATATGKKFKMPIEYNAAADKKSWIDMQAFLKEIFK